MGSRLGSARLDRDALVLSLKRAVASSLLVGLLAGCAASPTSVGHLEVWNRLLDPVVVVAGEKSFRTAACDHLAIDGVTLSGLSIERDTGSPFEVFDPHGVAVPLHGARFLVLAAGAALDLREPPGQVPPCAGHIGEPLDRQRRIGRPTVT